MAGNAGGSEVAQHHQPVAGSGGGLVDQQVNSIGTNGDGMCVYDTIRI